MSPLRALLVILGIGGLLYTLVTMPSRIDWDGTKEAGNWQKAWMKIPWPAREAITIFCWCNVVAYYYDKETYMGYFIAFVDLVP